MPYKRHSACHISDEALINKLLNKILTKSIKLSYTSPILKQNITVSLIMMGMMYTDGDTHP